jgi:hypothetical protein
MDVERIFPGDWPAVMESGRVPDAAFAAAYARVPDRHRAWIKMGLAAMYAACGGPMPLSLREEASLGHDLRLARLETPLDFAVILCGPACVSPVRLLAAVVPALCARVPDIAVVRAGAPWPHGLLTALELCGVETVCRVGARDVAGLWSALAGKGQGGVVLLDGFAAPGKTPDALRLLSARIAGRAGVFPETGAEFDRDALAFAHPDMTFCVHGETQPTSPPFAAATGTLAEATALGYDAVYAGGTALAAAQMAAPLVLGPGRETFWLWPQLSPAAFRRQRLTAAVENRADLVR